MICGFAILVIITHLPKHQTRYCHNSLPNTIILTVIPLLVMRWTLELFFMVFPFYDVFPLLNSQVIKRFSSNFRLLKCYWHQWSSMMMIAISNHYKRASRFHHIFNKYFIQCSCDWSMICCKMIVWKAIILKTFAWHVLLFLISLSMCTMVIKSKKNI